MNKIEYIEFLINSNLENTKNKKLYDDIIDCIDIALSQTSIDFEIDSSISLEELYKVIENVGKNSISKSVGPFEAAELIAKKLGTKYTRSSRKQTTNKIINLEDFL